MRKKVFHIIIWLRLESRLWKEICFPTPIFFPLYICKSCYRIPSHSYDMCMWMCVFIQAQTKTECLRSVDTASCSRGVLTYSNKQSLIDDERRKRQYILLRQTKVRTRGRNRECKPTCTLSFAL